MGKAGDPCRNPKCGVPLKPGRHCDELCTACYLRWYRAGKPDEVPDPKREGYTDKQRKNALRSLKATAERRLQRYRKFKVDEDLPTKVAAHKAGISMATAYKFNRILTERGYVVKGNRSKNAKSE